MKHLNEQFLQVYDELADAIFRHCYFRVSDRERAKELTQEVFMKTWEYMAHGDSIKNIKSFLYKVANNLIIDEYRKKKSVSLDELRDSGFEPKVEVTREIESSLDAKGLLTVVEKLDIKHREVIIMRYIDDLSPKEIAEIVGESENNVSVRLHRAIKKIRDIMQTNE